MNFALAIDILLVGLLAAAIAGMGLLWRRLGELRAGRGDFERLIAQLSDAAARAEAAGHGLRRSAEATDQGLGAQIARGQTLKDELVFLAERGERLAEEIGNAVQANRGTSAQGAARPAPARREERPLPASLAGLR